MKIKSKQNIYIILDVTSSPLDTIGCTNWRLKDQLDIDEKERSEQYKLRRLKSHLCHFQFSIGAVPQPPQESSAERQHYILSI